MRLSQPFSLPFPTLYLLTGMELSSPRKPRLSRHRDADRGDSIPADDDRVGGRLGGVQSFVCDGVYGPE